MSLPAYANNQQSFPAMYEQWLVGPLFRPWAEVLLDLVGPAAGERVLDMACGTGIVARLMHEYQTNAALRETLKGYTDLWLTGRREIYRVV